MKISLLPGWGLGLAPLQPLVDRLSRLHEVQQVPLPECTSLEQALDELDAQIAADSWLAGWSLGGMLATALAHRRGSRCPGLITLGSNACFVARDDWPHAMPERDFKNFSRRAARDWAGTLGRFELLCLQGEDVVVAAGPVEEQQALAEVASTSYARATLTGMEIAGSSPAMTDDVPSNFAIPAPSSSVIPAPSNSITPVSFNSVIPGLDPGVSQTGTEVAGSNAIQAISALSVKANRVTAKPAQVTSLAWLAELDNRQTIAELGCPQLHVLAEQDALVPVAAAGDLRRLNPQAQVDVLPGSHAFILTRYQAVAEHLLAWLAESNHESG